MSQSPLTAAKTFGYLTVVCDPDAQLTGGYLITAANGRPLEFHCTAPVRPSRAQEILYGPTLRAYFYVEVLGAALLSRGKARPSVLLVDDAVLLQLSDGGQACAYVPGDQVEGEHFEGDHVEGDVGAVAPGASPLTVGSQTLWLAGADRQIEALGGALSEFAKRVELTEPFERIREALQEVHKLGNDGGAPDAQAA